MVITFKVATFLKMMNEQTKMQANFYLDFLHK